MKYFLLATLLLLAGAAPAQTAPSPASASAGPYRYCALVVDDSYFSGFNSLSLDYGYRKAYKIGQADATLDAAEQLIRKNSSVIFALNYLSSLGWECFNVTSVTIDGNRRTIETRYLFRQPKP
jgi:hypothetical protein